MKKTRFFSMLTSLAVTSSLVLAAMPFTVNAEASPVSLEMVSGKTKFSLDDVKDGKAKTTIYVNVTSELTEANEVTEIDFEIVPETWGKVDPKNLMLSDPNQLATPEGGPFLDEGFVLTSSGTVSEWTTDVEKPTVSYLLQDYKEAEKYEGYTDTVVPKAMLFTNSSLGYMITGDKDAGDHFAQFDVYLPSDLEAGTYDINFRNPKSILGNSRDDNVRTLSIEDAKGITITVTEGEIDDDDFLLGDANLDKKVNVRDCATIASALAKGKGDSLPERESDYNEDGKVNVRDAAALASDLSKGTVKVK